MKKQEGEDQLARRAAEQRGGAGVLPRRGLNAWPRSGPPAAGARRCWWQQVVGRITGARNPRSPGNAAETEMLNGNSQVCELLALI